MLSSSKIAGLFGHQYIRKKCINALDLTICTYLPTPKLAKIYKGRIGWSWGNFQAETRLTVSKKCQKKLVIYAIVQRCTGCLMLLSFVIA